MAEPTRPVSDYPRVEPIIDDNGLMVIKFAQTLTDIINNTLIAPVVVDASVTSAQIETDDIGTAPASYTQIYAQEQTDLINEEKAVINTLVTDVTDAITQLNAFLAANQAALQMSTT